MNSDTGIFYGSGHKWCGAGVVARDDCGRVLAVMTHRVEGDFFVVLAKLWQLGWGWCLRLILGIAAWSLSAICFWR